MAFVRLKNRGDDPDFGLTSKKPGLRWVAVPAIGAVIALWSVATIAGLYSVGASLTAASNGVPQSLLAPRTIALADPRRALSNSWAPQLSAKGLHRQAARLDHCDAGCVRSASSFSFAHDGKMARLRPAPRQDRVALKTVASNAVAGAKGDRFDSVVARAELSPQKLAAAFSRAQDAPFMLASLPAASRFAGPLTAQNGPAPARFGSDLAEAENASSLALALANVLPEETLDVPTSVALGTTPAPDVAAAAPEAADARQAEVQLASLPPQDELPDNIAVPALRPRTVADQPAEAPKAEKPQTARSQPVEAQPAQTRPAQTQPAQTRPAQAQPAKARTQIAAAPAAEAPQAPTLSPRSSEQAAVPAVQDSRGTQGSPGMQGSRGIQGSRAKPGRRTKAQAAEMLAYAKPDVPQGGLGNAFRNLFNSPSVGNGVAVYDISAKTVYMPDGSRLEAHSGLGSMVDQPRYVDKKNTGPTPPDTYNLSLRESRFHGVEAIRLTPTSGSNKYGRNGLLAHTYMLRGGRAESNGCVVFRDYARFLAAYKRGKVTRLVVVPRLSKPQTRVAQEGRAG